MEYNQPYGGAPNAPYINGNPSTGVAGSIPPAASIEYPQREIVNFIVKNAITPTNGDLNQLSKSVQAGAVNYALDAGTTNALSVTLNPAPDVILPGFLVRLKILNNITGPSTLNVGTGIKPIVRSDGSPTVNGDGAAGEIAQFIFDGTSYQKQGLSLVQAGPTTQPTTPGLVLTANRTFFVDGNIGSDTLYDGSASTISAPHGPFLTIQKAVNQAGTLNANGFDITISIANFASYGPFNVVRPTNGRLFITGNIATPGNVIVTTSVAGAPCCATNGTGVSCFVRGIKVISLGAGGYGFLAQANANITFSDVEVGTCLGSHFFCDSGTIFCFGSYRVSGGASAHITLCFGEFILTPNPSNVITIVGSVTVTYVCVATDVAFVRGSTNTTWSGSFAAGTRYYVASNAVIEISGGGAAFFPAPTVGVTFTGGQYI